jgi:hypothetical protein
MRGGMVRCGQMRSKRVQTKAINDKEIWITEEKKDGVQD